LKIEIPPKSKSKVSDSKISLVFFVELVDYIVCLFSSIFSWLFGSVLEKLLHFSLGFGLTNFLKFWELST